MSRSEWCPYSGKHIYSTKKKALNAANNINKHRGINLSVYKCPDCRYYHLTKNRRDRNINGGSLIEGI